MFEKDIDRLSIYIDKHSVLVLNQWIRGTKEGIKFNSGNLEGETLVTTSHRKTVESCLVHCRVHN